MISHISCLLEAFRPCFTRQAAYHWFVIVMMGFIVRIDYCGVSSFVRWLATRPSLYTALLSFFRAQSWKLGTITRRWWQIVLESSCPVEIDSQLSTKNTATGRRAAQGQHHQSDGGHGGRIGAGAGQKVYFGSRCLLRSRACLPSSKQYATLPISG
jgi:hypothetical protein